MRFISRTIQKVIREAVRGFPAMVLTGPRRTGKSTLLRHMFPRARYVLLEDPDVQARARSDPRALLDELRPPVLFDEIQNVPELFPYIRTRIDENPREMGKWLFTGSQEAGLMQGVTESMSGRAAILQLLSFSLAETDRVSLLHGGYPEVIARPTARELWFSSYIQTYLERDVRAMINIRDLATFRRFLAMLASRHGQILNKTDLAAPLGVSVPTLGPGCTFWRSPAKSSWSLPTLRISASVWSNRPRCTSEIPGWPAISSGSSLKPIWTAPHSSVPFSKVTWRPRFSRAR